MKKDIISLITEGGSGIQCNAGYFTSKSALFSSELCGEKIISDINSVQWEYTHLDAFYIHQNFLNKVLTSPQHGQIPNRDIERKGNKGFRSYQLVGKEVNSYGAIFFLERMYGQTSV